MWKVQHRKHRRGRTNSTVQPGNPCSRWDSISECIHGWNCPTTHLPSTKTVSILWNKLLNRDVIIHHYFNVSNINLFRGINYECFYFSPYDAKNPFLAQIAVNRELHKGGDRSCLHIELDISDSKMRYEAGKSTYILNYKKKYHSKFTLVLFLSLNWNL